MRDDEKISALEKVLDEVDWEAVEEFDWTPEKLAELAHLLVERREKAWTSTRRRALRSQCVRLMLHISALRVMKAAS